MILRIAVSVLLCLYLNASTLAQETNVPAEYRELVPYRLLALVHASEVQNELGLSVQQIKELETYFFTVSDGPWFRSRILAQEKQIAELNRLESEFWDWAKSHWTAQQIARLKQLEVQSLGSRMLLRSDVAKQMGLTTAEQKTFVDLARTSWDLNRRLFESVSKGESKAELEKEVKQAAQAEQLALMKSLTTEQLKKLSKLTGPIFDTAKLQRVYPMAPEFDETTSWLNGSPMTLESLRGKVVLVHFYAFQCHNCHANFEIYRRWHEQLREKGVVVIGIQSPETEDERDPEKIRQAAMERKLMFPIIVDTKMENWNAWANTMWPTVYVIDKRGYLRHWWQGELNWQGAKGDKEIERIVETALAEKDS